MIHENFVIIGSIINFLGSVNYLINTLKGKVKPNKVTFLMWTIAPLVTFFAQFKSGIGIQSLLVLTMGLTTLLIFLASFSNKKSKWKLTVFDLFCGILSFTGLILYLLTEDAVLAISFSIIADILASLPTVIKSFFHPETETGFPYLATLVSTILTLLTLKSWNFINSAFTINVLIISLVIYVLVEYKIGKSILRSLRLKHA